jgi:hypothetical protein
MKYIVTKTDIFLKGKVYQEGSIIDSKNFTEEDIESVAHLLEAGRKNFNVAVTLAPEEKTDSKPESTSRLKKKQNVPANQNNN